MYSPFNLRIQQHTSFWPLQTMTLGLNGTKIARPKRPLTKVAPN